MYTTYYQGIPLLLNYVNQVPFPFSCILYGLNLFWCLLQTSEVNVMRPCWIGNLDPFNWMWHLMDSGIPCGVIAHNGDSALPSLLLSLSPLMCELPQMHLRNRRLIGRTPLWGMVYSWVSEFEACVPIWLIGRWTQCRHAHMGSSIFTGHYSRSRWGVRITPSK